MPPSLCGTTWRWLGGRGGGQDPSNWGGGDLTVSPLPSPPPNITHLCLGGAGGAGGAFLPPLGLCPLFAALSLGDGGWGGKGQSMDPPQDPNIEGWGGWKGTLGTSRGDLGPLGAILERFGAI